MGLEHSVTLHPYEQAQTNHKTWPNAETQHTCFRELGLRLRCLLSYTSVGMDRLLDHGQSFQESRNHHTKSIHNTQFPILLNLETQRRIGLSLGCLQCLAPGRSLIRCSVIRLLVSSPKTIEESTVLKSNNFRRAKNGPRRVEWKKGVKRLVIPAS